MTQEEEALFKKYGIIGYDQDKEPDETDDDTKISPIGC